MHVFVTIMDFETIKTKFMDATKTFKGKTKDKIKEKTRSYDRNMLIDAVYSLIDIADDLVSTVEKENDYLDKLAKKFTEKTEGMIGKLIGNNNNNENLNAKEPINSEKHVLIVDGTNEDSNDKISPDTWAQVVKSDISVKLKNVPVSKTVLSKDGKGCIFLPDEKGLKDAQEALTGSYRVNATSKKPTMILPKIKINNLNPDNYQSNDQLKSEILAKNMSINSLLENDNNSKMDVIFIDKSSKSALLKVTPNIRETVMKNQKIYLDLESHHVSDSFHVQQCYHCQSFGHKANSGLCPSNNTKPTCFYCSLDHKSKECRNKDNKSKHKCVNCNKSNNKSIKEGASKHNASSRSCPLYQREIELIRTKTCYDSKNFQSLVTN